MRFHAVDGLRAYLAWTVVAAHVVWYTGAIEIVHRLHWLADLGFYAVIIFILISGFVITHLIVEAPEPYFDFITKRFFRLYPAYAFCLVLAVVSTQGYDHLMLARPWGNMTPNIDAIARDQFSLRGWGFAQHYLAHVTLLHGILSDSRLYDSGGMFLAPAWSLSLEWQFYLVALLVVPFTLNRVGLALISLLAITGLVLFKRGFFGEFELPSTLAFGGPYFLIGILTRLSLPSFPTLRRGYVVAMVALCIAIFATDRILPILFWAIFVCYLSLQNSGSQYFSIPRQTGNIIFGSQIVQTLGKWSYSTYLVHAPIIQLLIIVLVKFRISFVADIAAVSLLTVPLTILASFLLYKLVEVPFIDFGKRRVNQHRPVQLLRLQGNVPPHSS